MVEYQPLNFNRWYVYPYWAYALGWLLALSSILLVPGWALGRMCAGEGSLKQVRMKIYSSLIRGMVKLCGKTNNLTNVNLLKLTN